MSRVAHERDRSRSRERRPERFGSRPERGGARVDVPGGGGASDDGPPRPPELPDFALSGALARDAATRGSAGAAAGAAAGAPVAALRWSEPADAASPAPGAWRLFIYKDGVELPPAESPLRLRSSACLFGRDASLADVPLAHASASGQHAVIQFRRVARVRDGGGGGGDGAGGAQQRLVVLPYLVDLESTNGTRLNGERVEPARLIELRSGDVVAFGASTREYVLMHAA